MNCGNRDYDIRIRCAFQGTFTNAELQRLLISADAGELAPLVAGTTAEVLAATDDFNDYFPPQVMGTVLGGITMTSSVGMAFGPVGGGWIFDNFGDYHWLYVSSALIGLAAAAMALVFPPAKRQQTGDMLAA